MTATGYGLTGRRAVDPPANHRSDTVVTDGIMPQMGDKEMADRLRVICPETRILFTSGYSNDALAHHGVLKPGVAFLEKPFSPARLADKVREVLDS